MASALLPVLGDLAGGLVSSLLRPSSPDVIVPTTAAAPDAPAVLDTAANAAQDANIAAQDQRKKSARLAALATDSTKAGSMNSAPTTRTLLGD